MINNINILEVCKTKMEISYNNIKKKINNVRSGKVNLDILSDIKVLHYNKSVSIEKVSFATIKDPLTILIKPWEKTMVSEIKNSIINSNLGLSATSHEDSIFINFLPLTQETRINLIKQTKSEGENGKIIIRNLRKLSKEDIKKNKEISKDEIKGLESDLQKLTDNYIKMINIKKGTIFLVIASEYYNKSDYIYE